MVRRVIKFFGQIMTTFKKKKLYLFNKMDLLKKWF